MTCRSVRNRLPGYLDGAVASREHRALQQHLSACPACRSHLLEYQKLSQLMSRTEPVAPPADLALRIRIAHSHQHSARTFIRRMWDRFQIRVENMLEPVALPATGGVLGAFIVFGVMFPALLGGVPLGAVPNDLPMNFIQPARLESLAPFSVTNPGAAEVANLGDILLVMATVNDRGEVVDYEILSGPRDSVTRRSLDQVLLFSRFRPQMSFGRPTSRGRVLLSFGAVDVRG